MPAKQYKKNYLEKKAEKFIKQKPQQYSNLSPFEVPDKEGIYYISLKTKNGELPVYLNYTYDLQKELAAKQLFHTSRIERCSFDWLKEYNVEDLAEAQAAALNDSNLNLRFLIEPNVQDRMALTVILATLLKPEDMRN